MPRAGDCDALTDDSMMYKTLFDNVSPDRVVSAGIIGTGHFATAIVTQSVSIPRLQVPAVADIQVEAGVKAFKQAGIPEARHCHL